MENEDKNSKSPPPASVAVDYAVKSKAHDPYVAMRFANYRRYFVGNVCAALGTQMAAVAVGWEIYVRTNSKVALGMVGLVQVIPIVALALPAGHVVDRFNRKNLVMAASFLLAISYTLMGLSSRYTDGSGGGVLQAMNNGLAWLASLFGEKNGHFSDAHIPLMFLLLLVNGVARAFNQPAKHSLMPALVPVEHFSNAVTWNATAFETSNVVGPMIGGFVIAWLTATTDAGSSRWAFACIYLFNAACQVVLLLNLLGVKLDHVPRREKMTWDSMLAGVRFVGDNKVILGTITLDLFAVLLGGATSLLPAFAKDILNIGPAGLGWLRAAPSIGAVSMALIIAHLPPMKRAGRNLLLCVAGFGLTTIVFGLSRNFWISLIALALTGAFDNVSVVVRHSLVQLLTPDDMRGRVNAVNSVFISTSNELGEFESGITAAIAERFFGIMWGPMIAVAAGGVGTIAVVAAVAILWPAVGQVKELGKKH